MGVEEAERRIRSLRSPVRRPLQLHLRLQANRRSGELVLRTYNLAIGYQDEGRPLFHVPDLVFRRGECAAIIGPNGAGKTTFLKTLLGQLPPLEGEVLLGASLNVAYFAQAHEDLNPERTLVKEIESVAPRMLEADIRSYLARFLFSGDEVYKPVSTLSGGERGRLALAKLSLTEANLLLLDEPTNHLDIPSQEVLQDVLASYGGTILLVSHDRYLIDALGTQIWEIRPDEAGMNVYEGRYSRYKAEQEAEKADLAQVEEKQVDVRRERSRADSNREKRRLKRLEQIESQVAELETELSRLSETLADPPSNPDIVQELGENYVEIQNEINALLSEWEGLHV
jgi:ATP-binding cassette subfamily F protein 3